MDRVVIVLMVVLFAAVISCRYFYDLGREKGNNEVVAYIMKNIDIVADDEFDTKSVCFKKEWVDRICNNHFKKEE